MSRKRPATTLAQPPWTYAPAEVVEWLSSGAERTRRRRTAREGPAKGVRVRCSISAGERALRRFDRVLSIGRRSPAVAAAPPSLGPSTIVRKGTYAGVTVLLVAHTSSDAFDIRIRFRPRLSAARARRLLAELGISPREAVVL